MLLSPGRVVRGVCAPCQLNLSRLDYRVQRWSVGRTRVQAPDEDWDVILIPGGKQGAVLAVLLKER